MRTSTTMRADVTGTSSSRARGACVFDRRRARGRATSTSRASVRPQDGAGDDAPPRAPGIQQRGSAERLTNVQGARAFRLGVFADAQYGDKADEERADEKGRVKYFRRGASRLAECYEAFAEHREELSGIINLGDLFDGYNEDDKSTWPVLRTPMSAELVEKNRRDLSVMSEIQKSAPSKVHHCIGNHDCSVPRVELLEALGVRDGLSYYSTRLPRRWRLIILDTTDVNPRYMPSARDSEEYRFGMEFVSSKGRHEIAPWGGGIGPTQMQWLRDELESAKANGERVIVASHNALHVRAAREKMSAWNADEVSALFEEYCATVKICLAGHDHPGDYYMSKNGVHYVTLEAMLEANTTSYAYLTVYDHVAELQGVGIATSRRMRVSPHGVFTGIATFGADTIADIAGTGSPTRIESTELSLVEWINKYGRDKN